MSTGKTTVSTSYSRSYTCPALSQPRIQDQIRWEISSTASEVAHQACLPSLQLVEETPASPNDLVNVLPVAPFISAPDTRLQHSCRDSPLCGV
jgi:hypothetical protein